MWKGWSVSRGTTSYSSFISLFLVASLEPAVLARVVEQGRRVVAQHEAIDPRHDDRVVAAVVNITDGACEAHGRAGHERFAFRFEVLAAERARVREDAREPALLLGQDADREARAGIEQRQHTGVHADAHQHERRI